MRGVILFEFTITCRIGIHQSNLNNYIKLYYMDILLRTHLRIRSDTNVNAFKIICLGKVSYI